MYDIAFLIAAFNEEDYIEDCVFSCLQEKDFNIQHKQMVLVVDWYKQLNYQTTEIWVSLYQVHTGV